MDLQAQLEELKSSTQAKLAEMRGNNAKELQELRVQVLGKKGSLTELLKGLKDLSKEMRPVVGKQVNEVRDVLTKAFEEQAKIVEAAKIKAQLESESLDVTLPGRQVNLGNRHVLTQTSEEIEDIFLGMGFQVVDGYEVESDYYNFERMNLPKDHPARDMQDSFYITEDILLRSQTSPVQARTMQAHEPNSPIRIIAPGHVYRRDDYDATHSPMFTQVEGLCIDKNINFADLKGTLVTFLQQIFGEDVKVRFRPSFFPFTEPSAEVDISCVMCKGKGCRVCKGTGWLEILGAGMVHPHVLEMSGYDPKQVSGFAFGMGVERIAMLAYGIDDLRLFYDNDVRFLRQF